MSNIHEEAANKKMEFDEKQINGKSLKFTWNKVE